jgi:hypothetical protein
VHGDGLTRRVALGEVVALEQPRHRVVGAQAHEVGCGEIVHPLAVEADLGPLHVEEQAGLLDVGGRVGLDLLGTEGRARLLLAGGISDPSGEVPHQEDGGVTQVLEAAQLHQHHGVPEVDVGRRRIQPQLDAQRTSLPQGGRQAWAQVLLAVELHGAVAHHVELALDLLLELGLRHVALGTQRNPTSLTIASTARSRESCGTLSSSWNA